MHIGVIGLGNFGSALARRLYDLGHQVSALDIKTKALATAQDFADQAVTADATDRSVLEELGLGLADAAVVSLGANMAASILVTLHLREMKVGRIISKAISADHEKILKRVGATEVLFPERDAAERLATSLAHPNLLDYLPLGGEFSVAEVSPISDWVGKTLVDVSLRTNYDVNVIAIRELVPERMTVVIKPDYKIKDSDVLVVLGRQEDIQKLPTIK
jgi:trk system potassium uptake protein TrkA